MVQYYCGLIYSFRTNKKTGFFLLVSSLFCCFILKNVLIYSCVFFIYHRNYYPKKTIYQILIFGFFVFTIIKIYSIILLTDLKKTSHCTHFTPLRCLRCLRCSEKIPIYFFKYPQYRDRLSETVVYFFVDL